MPQCSQGVSVVHCKSEAEPQWPTSRVGQVTKAQARARRVRHLEHGHASCLGNVSESAALGSSTATHWCKILQSSLKEPFCNF